MEGSALLRALLHSLSESSERLEGKELTPLMTAALRGERDERIRELATADTINAQDKTGKTALIHVSGHRNLNRIFFLLLELGADPTIVTPDGLCALGFATTGCCHHRVQALLRVIGSETARNLITEPGGDKSTNMVIGTVRGQGEDDQKAATLSFLLRVPGITPDISPVSGDGRTALHHACRQGLFATVSILLSAGADPSRPQERDGWTPLHLAAHNGHFTIVTLLLSFGARTNIRLPDDTTPAKFARMTPEELARKSGKGKIAVLLRIHNITLPTFGIEPSMME